MSQYGWAEVVNLGGRFGFFFRFGGGEKGGGVQAGAGGGGVGFSLKIEGGGASEEAGWRYRHRENVCRDEGGGS